MNLPRPRLSANYDRIPLSMRPAPEPDFARTRQGIRAAERAASSAALSMLYAHFAKPKVRRDI